jgi:hypothetical protein
MPNDMFKSKGEVMEEIKSLAVIEESNTSILSEAQNLVVCDSESKLKAETILVSIRKQIKHIDSERKSWTDPLEQQKKRLIDIFKRVTQPLVDMDSKLSNDLGIYRMKLADITRKKELRLQALQEKRNERAKQAGKPNPLPETVIPYVAQPERSVSTENGKVTYIKTYKAYVTDESKVPILFGDVMIRPVNMVAINKLVGAGIRNIPGIEVKEEEISRVN